MGLSYKLCVCGSVFALIFLLLIMIGVWTMPYRMKKVSDKNPLGF
tara:strand:- start:64 stop:198 length:135 start_codon:yes stop_codon:yes gene_type:complete